MSAVAILIADNISDNDTLELLAALLTQLGDTLATITLQRAMVEGKWESAITSLYIRSSDKTIAFIAQTIAAVTIYYFSSIDT